MFFFATIDRCSVMTGMYRRSMMIYSSLYAKFKGTKPSGRIHRYGASIFGDIIINISKSINKEKQIFWRLQYIARFDVPSVLIASRTGFLQLRMQDIYPWYVFENHQWGFTHTSQGPISYLTIGYVTLVVITGTIIPVPTSSLSIATRLKIGQR